MPGTQEPGRSINRFVIGSNVTDWPYHSADANQTDLLVFNTDTSDPPCIGQSCRTTSSFWVHGIVPFLPSGWPTV